MDEVSSGPELKRVSGDGGGESGDTSAGSVLVRPVGSVVVNDESGCAVTV